MIEEILHKRIFSWDAHLESKYMSQKRIFSWDAHLDSKYMSQKRIWDAHLESKYVSHKQICFCEQSVCAESPLPGWAHFKAVYSASVICDVC